MTNCTPYILTLAGPLLLAAHVWPSTPTLTPIPAPSPAQECVAPHEPYRAPILDSGRALRAVERLATLDRVRWSPEWRMDLAGLVSTESARTGVPVSVLLSVCWYESRCTPTAISDDGCACGLTQVRSSRCIDGRPSCEALQDPATAFAWTADHLTTHSLAAYAAGPSGASRTGARRYESRALTLATSLETTR